MKRALIQKLFQRFCSDRAGSVLPIFAGMAVILIVVAGSAVDYSRAVANREKVGHALDAAALSVAAELSTSLMTESQIEAALEEAFSANLHTHGLDESAISNLNHTLDTNNGVLAVSSSVTVDTQFIKLGGIGPDDLTVGVNTEVNYSSFYVELALVLDVTGSMGSDIDTLQEAAEELLDTLIPEGTSASASKIKISIVPYSQGVNLGSYASTVTDGESDSDNCVATRPGDEAVTDAVYNYDGSSSEYFWSPGALDYFVYDYGSSESWNSAYDACPDVELVPLTANRSTLEDTIGDLDDGGGTAGQTGIAWGWYTLSPNWTSLWPTASDPETYDNEEVLKFAVIMTDGSFNLYYGEKDRTTCSGKGKKKTCSTNTYETEVYLPYADENDEPATAAKDLCDGMKDDGISIYSIYFDTGGSGFGEDLMEYCADDSSQFFSADSSDDLISAFGTIAKKIQAIYLAK